MGKSTAIAGQRPSKRRKRHASERRRVIAHGLLRLAFISGSIFLVIALPWYIATKVQNGFREVTTSQKNQVILLSENGPLTDFDNESLQKNLVSAANEGQPLEKLAQKAAAAAPLSRINIIRTAPDKVIVKFSRRTPKLRIMLEDQKLIDSSGFVYGKCCSLPGQEAESQLPLLEGLAKIDDRGLVADSQLVLIKEAISLGGALVRFDLNPDRIRYQMHRGFFVVLQPDNLEISFGRGPFEGKLERLRDVLKQVDRNKISRVELDYHGKAFIRERKI